MKLFKKSIIFKSIIYFIKRNYILRYNPKILQRGACLSNDALKILYPDSKITNFQKSRVDYLNLQLLNNKIKPGFVDVLLIRPHLYNLYIEQSYNFWKQIIYKEILIMDSYSELTDQLFINKKDNNQQFCANFSDVVDKSRTKYICKGLLDSNQILFNYDFFFNKIRELNSNIKIIYIFFPIQFETRPKFINQNKSIENSISKLAIIHDINIVSIPDTLLNFKRDDEFPYHYNKDVYNYVANKIKMLIC